MVNILVINGPNLNNLGNRDPKTYGTITLEEINQALKDKSVTLKSNVLCFQSNHEGEIVDFIQSSSKKADGIIINGGALSQVGYSILDALIDCQLPYVEVHLSNIFSRENFRQKSVLSGNAIGQICGLGIHGYLYGLEHLVKLLAKNN